MAIAIYFWLQNKQSIVFEARDVLYLHSQIMKFQMLQTDGTLSYSKVGDSHYQRQYIGDKVKGETCDGSLSIYLQTSSPLQVTSHWWRCLSEDKGAQ